MRLRADVHQYTVIVHCQVLAAPYMVQNFRTRSILVLGVEVVVLTVTRQQIPVGGAVVLVVALSCYLLGSYGLLGLSARMVPMALLVLTVAREKAPEEQVALYISQLVKVT